MRSSTLREERESTGGTTARLVFALVAGNVLATVAVAAFLFPGENGLLEYGDQLNLVLAAGTLSLVASGLLFMLAALRRGHRAWWTVVTAVNLVQVGRLVPALAAISVWPENGGLPGLLWGAIAVPLFSVLASLGIIVMVRQMRRAKRRRQRTLLA